MERTAAKTYGFKSSSFILLLCCMLVGCMVGPDFHPPAPPPEGVSYTGMPEPKKTIRAPQAGKAGKQQKFVYNKDIPSEWWHLFHSPEIDDLIRTALLNSPNLAAAKAALTNAQQTLYAQIGSSMLPNISFQPYYQRQRFAGATLGSTRVTSIFNLYNVSLNASYTLDFFGGLRRQIEAQAAQVDHEAFELEAAYLTMTSNIVITTFTIASLREQIQATHELIHLQQNLLRIVQSQFELGGASKGDVLLQQSQLEQTRATLPPLEQNLAKNLHALSVLIGDYPNEHCLPKFNLTEFNLPTKLPVSIPCALVQQRPDIRAAEALLHAASAQVGVATANLYPQLNLTATYGFADTVFTQLFSAQARYWSYMLQLTQPIFNGGALIAQRRAAIAAFQQAAATYQQTVLQAFQNVGDTLRALQNDAKELKAQKAAEVAAYQSLKLIQRQFRLGGVSYINLLTAQRQYQQSRINLIQATAARYTDTAALFQALGGGWWNRPPLDCNTYLKANVDQYRPGCF